MRQILSVEMPQKLPEKNAPQRKQNSGESLWRRNRTELKEKIAHPICPVG